MTTLEDHTLGHQEFKDPKCEFCDLDLQETLRKQEEEDMKWWNSCSH